jgi:RND family efflux transporter MFP subunit
VGATIDTARTTAIADVRVTTGTVRAGTSATLAAKLLGNVTRVLVSEGDRVRAGQVLVEIDGRDVRARVDQARASVRAADEALASATAAIDGAEANAQFAAATYKRFAALRERGSVSPHEFEEVEARQKGAQSELDRARRGRDALVAQRDQARGGVTEAETFLSYTSVRSPIDGIVSARFVDPGAQAAPGLPLVSVESLSSYRVETAVDEELAGRLRAGDIVHVDGTPSRVANVAPVDAQTRSALVKIELPSAARLRTGAFVHVAFPVGFRTAITVPGAAVAQRGQVASVFVLDDSGSARMRLVTTGARQGQAVEILAGLEPGERFVTKADGVTDGVRVRGAM